MKILCGKNDAFDCAGIRAQVFRLPADCSNHWATQASDISFSTGRSPYIAQWLITKKNNQMCAITLLKACTLSRISSARVTFYIQNCVVSRNFLLETLYGNLKDLTHNFFSNIFRKFKSQVIRKYKKHSNFFNKYLIIKHFITFSHS